MAYPEQRGMMFLGGSNSMVAHMIQPNAPPRAVVNPLPSDPAEPQGMDCFADDREALNDFAKYFNNAHLSDVMLMVGEESYPAHRIILTKSSEVFDRMLSQRWSSDRDPSEKKELALVDEPQCQRVFKPFLRFLYCNNVYLHTENTLPLLVLADKYNVNGLKKLCIDYAMHNILRELSPREIFHTWYSYATKAYHQPLISACIKTLAWNIEEMITSESWEKEWLSIDRDQLSELLKSNDLHILSEYNMWEAVQKWLMAPNSPERRGTTAAPLLVSILPLIRFPFMTADELSLVERSSYVESHPRLFQPIILLSYKFQALPLTSRINCKDFVGTHFLLRNYGEIRWDKRIVVKGSDLKLADDYGRGIDLPFSIETRSSTFPFQTWKWKLQLASHTPNFSKLGMYLMAEDIDQPRSIEYLVSIVNERHVQKSVAGRKSFTKSRYVLDLDFDLTDVCSENSPMLVNGDLHMQITFRPID